MLVYIGSWMKLYKQGIIRDLSYFNCAKFEDTTLSMPEALSDVWTRTIFAYGPFCPHPNT